MTFAISLALAIGITPVGSHGSTETGVRVYAIGYKHLLSDGESYDSYRRHLHGLAERADPDPDADEDSREKVFLFPEDSALYAMFAGLRGLPFRTLEPVLRRLGGNGAAVAIAGLFAAYQPQAAYYRLRFPDQNLSQARLGLLALTDTLYRSFFETFREIAVEHQAWVVSSANVAPAKITTDPVVATLLGDPEARGRHCGATPPPCAYEATSESVYNQAFVFDPTGNLVFNPFSPAREGDLDGAVKKTYLVPIEEGPLEQGKIGLDLAYGDLRQVRPIEIAAIPMGIAISKPAWMVDELARLEAYDAQTILQPEAFSSWGSPVEDWSPDVLKESGWSHTQKHAPFRYSVLAELTGNFFDLVFDAQNHVVSKASTKTIGPMRYIGQPDDVGWSAVSPWIVGDGPGEACDAPTLIERRQCLAEVGGALAPASGDVRENAYLEPLVRANLDYAPVAVDPNRAGAAANVRVDDAPPGARARNPQIAATANGDRFVVWQDDRSGADQIRIARVRHDGTIEASRAVAPAPGVRQIAPVVAAGSTGALHVVWQELDPVPRLFHSYAPDPNAPFGIPRLISPALASDEGWEPAVAIDAQGRIHVAWIALIGGFERLVYVRLRVTNGMVVEEVARTIDDEAFPAPEPLAEMLNNRWNPSIAVRDSTVAVAWTDFRNYTWDLFATVSDDGGNSFGPHRRVDDASKMGGIAASMERLHNDPSVAITADGRVLVTWGDQAARRAGCVPCKMQRRPDSDVVSAGLAPGAAEFSSNVRVDDTGDGLATEDRVGFSNQWRPVLVQNPASGRLLAVWQDHREGNNDIYSSFSEDGGATWSANVRLDDTGAGWSNQYRPAAASDPAGAITVVWQDDRDGFDHVYLVLV